MAYPVLINISIILSLINFSFLLEAVDVNQAVIEGPGLDPKNLILPARYLFLHLTKNYSSLNGDVQVDFKVTGRSVDTGRPCRVWCNVLNRKDGSFVLRYKMYERCEDLAIHVKYKDAYIGGSPFKFEGIVSPETCMCGVKGVEEWLDDVKCGMLPKQIKQDLSVFPEINWDKIRKKVIKRFNKPDSISICHYVVKDNEIFRKCYGKHVGFNSFMDSILLSLTRKLRLPDVEFFANLGDWPLVKQSSELYPVISWCGSTDSLDIVIPTYDITQATIENMGRVMLDMLSVQGNTEEAWDNRIPKMFWRGRDSNEHRLKLIDISREHPDLFNVSMTNFFFYRDRQEQYGPKSEHVSFYKFFDYKYQINIDGTVAAYRMPYLLAGGSLLFKQDSKYYEHYYGKLIRNKHYVPVKRDLSDLMEKFRWALDNDEEAKQITENAKQFSNENLLPKDIYCYHAFLFNEYSKLLKSEVKVLDGMEKVKQPDDVLKCSCFEGVKDEL